MQLSPSEANHWMYEMYTEAVDAWRLARKTKDTKAVHVKIIEVQEMIKDVWCPETGHWEVDYRAAMDGSRNRIARWMNEIRGMLFRPLGDGKEHAIALGYDEIDFEHMVEEGEVVTQIICDHFRLYIDILINFGREQERDITREEISRALLRAVIGALIQEENLSVGDLTGLSSTQRTKEMIEGRMNEFLGTMDRAAAVHFVNHLGKKLIRDASSGAPSASSSS